MNKIIRRMYDKSVVEYNQAVEDHGNDHTPSPDQHPYEVAWAKCRMETLEEVLAVLERKQ